MQWRPRYSILHQPDSQVGGDGEEGRECWGRSLWSEVCQIDHLLALVISSDHLVWDVYGDFLYSYSTLCLLRSRLILLQENNEKQEERLAKATLELAGACQRADGAVREASSTDKYLPSLQFVINKGEEEDGAWERSLLQRGVHWQPRQAALWIKSISVICNMDFPWCFLQGDPGRLGEQVRGHSSEACHLGGGRPEGQREGRGSGEEDQGSRGRAEGLWKRTNVLFLNSLWPNLNIDIKSFSSIFSLRLLVRICKPWRLQRRRLSRGRRSFRLRLKADHRHVVINWSTSSLQNVWC